MTDEDPTMVGAATVFVFADAQKQRRVGKGVPSMPCPHDTDDAWGGRSWRRRKL
jgi:hypothetical protein